MSYLPTKDKRLVLDAFLAGRKKSTLRAYQGDIKCFMGFYGALTPTAMEASFFSLAQGEANELMIRFKDWMMKKGMTANTINRRVTAMRSFVKLGRMIGAVPWTLDIRPEKVVKYRDTSGPGREVFDKLVEILEQRIDPKGKRDLAILRLLHDMALRRHEVATLDFEHLDTVKQRLYVLGKGAWDDERIWLSIPRPTLDAINAWVTARGEWHGPLFVSLDCQCAGRTSEKRRLSDRSIGLIIMFLGQKLGIKLRPHGLRHTAITEALDKTNGDVRAVQRFSRHKQIQTLVTYDDNRTDMGGKIADLVAGDTKKKTS